MRKLFLATCLLGGISLLSLLAGLETKRDPKSSAYWLLIQEIDPQTQTYTYFLTSPDGDIRRPVMTSPDENRRWYLGWSVDGKYIFYRVNQATSKTPQIGIYRYDVDTRQTELLIVSEENNLQVDFQPSYNQEFIAIRIIGNGHTPIYILDGQGELLHELPDNYSTSMMWAQDSTQLYYTHWRESGLGLSRLDMDTFVEQPSSWQEPYYRYAPDKTAYAFFEDNLRDVWHVYDIITGNTTPLTPEEQAGYFVVGWLNKDWLLATRASNDENDYGLYRVHPDGSDWEEIYHLPSPINAWLTPFLNGQSEWIYFEYINAENQHILQRIHIETLETEEIIDNLYPDMMQIDYLNTYFSEPDYVKWLPEINRLMWLSRAENTEQFMLYRSHPDGTQRETLFSFDWDHAYIKILVSPDNQWVYLSMASPQRGGILETSVWRVNLTEPRHEKILNSNGTLVDISPPVNLRYDVLRLQYIGGGLFIFAVLGLILTRQRQRFT